LQTNDLNAALQSLNANQRIAVEWRKGPLLVLAGPGSGKTLVLTLRVAQLLRASPNKRFRVLGLTFTNKAAAEMRNRVDQLVPSAPERAMLTTFHSFAADLLRQHGSHVGISPDFTILSQEADREEVLRDAIQTIGKQHDVDDSDVRLLPLITNLLEKLVAPADVKTRIREPELRDKMSALYSAYREQLIQQNSLDFVSLIAVAHQLLTTNEQIAEHVRIVYPYICVDEFQDTNLAQYSFLQSITGPTPPDLFVVADDDQIVFQWSGASPERLEELKRDFRMGVVQLPENYRCPERVIDLANSLIRFNTDRSPEKQPFYAARKAAGIPSRKDAVRLKRFPDPDAELNWIAKDIKAKDASFAANSVILARTRAFAERACDVLNRAGVPAAIAIRKSEFESAPFRWLHAVLRLANTRGDREQLRRTCKAFYELEGVDLRVPDVVAAASALGGDLLRAWAGEALARKELAAYTRSFLKTSLQGLLEHLRFEPFIVDAFAWFTELQEHPTAQAGEIFADFDEERTVWKDLSSTIFRRFGSQDVSLNVFLQEMDLSPKYPPIPSGAVTCLTIHMAKGTEYDHVYLIGLAEDVLPSFQSIRKGASSREMQEERRSCFVAITRTRVDLTLTYADTYFGYSKQPSRFLREMGLINTQVF
jgi:DNA helicase II / ATP-dependent DNA helicase PcrA